MASHDENFPAVTNAEKSPSQRRAWTKTWARLLFWFWTLSSQLFDLLWLDSMIALLIFNFKNSIIGANVWCSLKKCPIEALSIFVISKTQKLNKNDHNTFDEFQFVAKFLKIWFVFVATNLIYNCTMLLIFKDKSLFIDFLMIHFKYKNLNMLLNCRFWKTIASFKNSKLTTRSSTFKLFLFAFFMIFMCILINLMRFAFVILILSFLQ